MKILLKGKTHVDQVVSGLAHCELVLLGFLHLRLQGLSAKPQLLLNLIGNHTQISKKGRSLNRNVVPDLPLVLLQNTLQLRVVLRTDPVVVQVFGLVEVLPEGRGLLKGNYERES